jgi:hypothetical protein
MSSVPPTVLPTVRPNHCSFCRQRGHNKRTCAERQREAYGVREDLDVQGFFARLEANDAAAAAAAAAASVVVEGPSAADVAPVVEAAPVVVESMADIYALWTADLFVFEAERAAVRAQARLRLDMRVAGCEAACVAHRVMDGMTVRQAVRRIELNEIPNPAPGLAGLMAPYADL